MAITAKELLSCRETQDVVEDLIRRGKKFIIQFENDKEVRDFMDKWGSLTGKRIGNVASLCATAFILAKTGNVMWSLSGGLIAEIIGTLIGYALGALIALLLHAIGKRIGQIKFKPAFSWFGLRPNRIKVHFAPAPALQ